jgi:hypothetical protein
MTTTAAKQCHYWRGFKSNRGSALGNAIQRGATRGGKLGRGGRYVRPFTPIAGESNYVSVRHYFSCLK